MFAMRQIWTRVSVYDCVSVTTLLCTGTKMYIAALNLLHFLAFFSSTFYDLAHYLWLFFRWADRL